MNKLTTAVTALSTIVVGGIIYFLTPNFGVDYTKKPAVQRVSVTERIVLPKSQSSQFTWQSNLDNATNPNPTAIDYIFPYTLCNKATYQSTVNTTSHTRTSNKPELREFLQEQIGKTNQLLKKDIPNPVTFFAPASSCQKELTQKILTAEVQYQGLASDDNSDRGLSSIFSPDDTNINTAIKRDKKIAKEIIQLTKNQPDVKIVAIKPAESNLSPDDIKLLLKKQYPFGNDFERQEIMAQISMIDRKVLKNSELENIMIIHRGVKVSVVQQIQTQQVISFPAPVALTPLLLLVPTIRISTFSFVRVLVTSGIYVINSFARIGISVLSQLIQSLLFILRLIALILKKLGQKISKLAYKATKVLVRSIYFIVITLKQKSNSNALKKEKLSKASENLDPNQYGVSPEAVTSSFKNFGYNVESLIIKGNSIIHVIIYNSCAFITSKPNDQEYSKLFSLPFVPRVQLLIHFKKCDQYTKLMSYVIESNEKKSSLYETEKIKVQIIKQ